MIAVGLLQAQHSAAYATQVGQSQVGAHKCRRFQNTITVCS